MLSEKHLQQKKNEIKNPEEFFSANKKVAVAFSGGCDSAFLAYSAVKNGAEIRAYFVKTQFQPKFELDDAVHFSEQYNIPLTIIEKNILASDVVVSNPSDRCYHCKKQIFSEIIRYAKNDGFSVLLDGTNASDASDDRPGMKAASELMVRSPLRECGLTKAMIRELSEKEGLFTWNKPAYACLATRIASGEIITAEKLSAIESSEKFLFDIGLKDFRVRVRNGNALIQLKENDIPILIADRVNILNELKKNYKTVSLDLEVR